MPMIINCNGKAMYRHPFRKLFIDFSNEYLGQFYNDLQKISLDKATDDALDRLSELYGFVRKHE